MRTTVSLNDALAAHVDDVRPSDDASDAEAVRECIRRSQSYEQQDDVEVERLRAERDQLQGRVEDLQKQVESLRDDLEAARAEKDDLRNQLRETNRRVDEHNELAKYVSEAEQRREAGLVQRVKWAIVGGSPTSD